MRSMISVLKASLCLVLVAAMGVTTTSAQRNCSGLQPSMEETLLLLDPLRQNYPKADTDAFPNRKSFLAGERRCNGSGKVYPEYQKASLCRGHLVISHNPNRCPPNIVEVRCNCHSCKGGNCQPVTYPRLVWEFEGGDDEPPKHKVYDVSVGCQCVRVIPEQVG